MLGVSVCWKVHIQPDLVSDSTDGETRFMYKTVKKTKVICRYMYFNYHVVDEIDDARLTVV